MWLDQRLEVDWGSSIDRLVCQYHHLESDASYYREPMEVSKEGGHMGEFRSLEHEARCRVLDRLRF